MVYFAYGSNMSRVRLERRVGPVHVVGVGTLVGYRHAFSKPGADGTGKGNIHPDPGHHVTGVVYRIDPGRTRELDLIEGGYRRAKISVRVAGGAASVHAYLAEAPIAFQAPSDNYLSHYESGIHEHGIALAYWVQILRQARGLVR